MADVELEEPGTSAAPRLSKVRARDIEAWYGLESRRGPVHALGPLDLDVADGEFVCIVGPSGCGKSTFLRNIAGLVKPVHGSLEVRAGAGATPVAMVFQEYSIFPWKTVRANVRLGLDAAGVSRRVGDERCERYLQMQHLADFAERYPHELSGGMKQRVAIARALAVEPDILLMDEPFAALDAQLRQVLQEELLELWQAHRRTVVFVTHSLEEALLLGDRVVVMSARPGRIIASHTVPFQRPRPATVRSDPAFTALRDELWALLRREVTSDARGAA